MPKRKPTAAPPRLPLDNEHGPEELRAWIERNVKPGEVFYVATSPFAFSKGLGFWKGDEPSATRQTLAAVQRTGIMKCERAFWRGMRCRRT